ncbi:MAG: ribosome biogenesis GTP-binding protein YihA/YsxC [Eubacterium sp.]|nr:ribosome biogenesis GTP-binding protein YihA/YsxC [Eubacterium sp.]MCH4046348.1 ribosome biogenesis GTP-binding protein YihA/YsxC [Eubacterium sp.]MCH4079443.1 ribosome biogenesis GTP-binding protein YihA/YsxC [Eubacterium sp.]MCH4111007.1 ribosome biogenesis GTP-binding protein YihA/YsxC [Eubacterium sp.]MCI1307169.1 ribosome biogenesis GTP-binding protein YihA/YsxC [Eubacterium sp.]
MKIVQSEIVATAVRPQQYPADNLAEVAFAGRSNVGKSSLLNLITGRKNLARVSASPGKTQTINFYLVNKDHDPFRIVDLPGYGYAKISKKVTQDWGEMMETFLTRRQGLRKVFQLVDIRHKPTAQDVQMYEFLKYYDLDGPVIATKADKVSKREAQKQMQIIRKTLEMRQDAVILPVSALKKTGVDQILDAIEEIVQNG